MTIQISSFNFSNNIQNIINYYFTIIIIIIIMIIIMIITIISKSGGKKVNNRLYSNQTAWFGHVKNMYKNRLPKKGIEVKSGKKEKQEEQ